MKLDITYLVSYLVCVKLYMKLDIPCIVSYLVCLKLYTKLDMHYRFLSSYIHILSEIMLQPDSPAVHLSAPRDARHINEIL